MAETDPTSAPRPLTGGAVLSAASQLVVAVTGAVATIFVARLLGPEGAGAYAVALSLFLLVLMVCSLGVENGVAYLVSSRRWSPRSAFVAGQVAALALGLAGAAIGLAVRLVASPAFEGVSLGLVAIVVAGIPLSLSWRYASYVALALDRYEAYSVPSAAQSAVAMVAVAGLAAGFELTGAIWGLTISQAVAALGTLAWASRALPAGEEDPAERAHRWRNLRAATAFGAKAYAANLLQFLNYRLDLFLLNALAAQAKVGHYSVAISVTSVMWLLPQALAAVVFPRVAALSAREGEEAEAHREMVETKSMRHIALIVYLSTAVLALALVLLVKPVYGGEFGPAIELGLILLPGVALIGISAILSATIVGRGRPEYSLYVALISTPPTIALYALLIPPLEATGAAIASSLSYASNFALAAIYFRRVTGMRVLPLLVPTASELADYRALPAAARAYLRRVRHA